MSPIDWDAKVKFLYWRDGKAAEDRQGKGVASLRDVMLYQGSIQSLANFQVQTAAAIQIQAAFRGMPTVGAWAGP